MSSLLILIPITLVIPLALMTTALFVAGEAQSLKDQLAEVEDS